MAEEEDVNLPIKTIARLFQTAVFEHDDTRITEKTLKLTAEYTKMFVREAILRANEDRLNPKDEPATKETTKTEKVIVDNQLVDDVLDVKHLENIAGLLVLDF